MAHKNLSIRLGRDLHRDLKVQAAKEERPLAELVERALQQYLNRRAAAVGRFRKETTA